MARLFLSYRRSDTGAYASRLAEHLRSFQFEAVFHDLEEVGLGDNYADEIRTALAGCDIVLVLIGKDWAGARGQDGRRRLDDPADWVRREVSIALAHGILTVPVLFDGAPPPTESDLSADLAPLATAQGYDIAGKYFKRDADDLARRLEQRLVRDTGRPQDDRSQTAPAAARQLQAITALLFLITIAFAVAPSFYPRLPGSLWLFPAAMTFSAFLWWLYWLGESIRPARVRTV